MSRYFITEAIVLKTSRIGEINKSVVLLTNDSGILYTIAYGACKIKSRLRAATQVLTHLRVYLYYNPLKQSYKISDIEVITIFEALSLNLEKYYIASLCIEVILKSYAAGESSSSIFSLFLNALKALENIKQDNNILVLVQFLWRFITVNGSRPELHCCKTCGKIIENKKPILFKEGIFGFLCQVCAGYGGEIIYPGIRKYIEMTEILPFNKALDLNLKKDSMQTLKKVMINLVKDLLEGPLYTVESGEGII